MNSPDCVDSIGLPGQVPSVAPPHRAQRTYRTGTTLTRRHRRTLPEACAGRHEIRDFTGYPSVDRGWAGLMPHELLVLTTAKREFLRIGADVRREGITCRAQIAGSEIERATLHSGRVLNIGTIAG